MIKVKQNQFEYEEEVKEFTGLIFHCPNCDEVFHLHIATIKLIWNDNWCINNGFSTNVGIKEQIQKYIMLKSNLKEEDLK